jgi:hypothetical protein
VLVDLVVAVSSVQRVKDSFLFLCFGLPHRPRFVFFVFVKASLFLCSSSLLAPISRAGFCLG